MRTFTQKVVFALIALMCFAMPQTVMAQDCVDIGEGTTAGNSYVPVANWYHNSYTQQLYTADEINHGAANITSISFAYGNATSMTRKISIYLANTDAASLSSSYVTEGLEEVFSAAAVTFDNTSDWVTIELTTPFAYDGTSNLLVAVWQDADASIETGYGSGNRFIQTSMTGMARSQQTDNSGASAYTLVDGVPTTGTGSAVAYRPNIQFCFTGGSAGPTCDRPDDLTVTGVTSNQATLTWAGGSGTYTVEYQAVGAEDWEKVLNASTLTTCTLNDLQPQTKYSVRVKSVCGENSSGYKTASFTTMIALPYSEKFTTDPVGWNRYKGVLADVMAGTATFTSSTLWSFTTANGVFDRHAKVEVYSTRNEWLITPVIPIEDNVQLTFDLALTHWTGTNVPAPQNPQPDARFVVLVTPDEGATWSILREWNNTGSTYVFDNIMCSADGEEVELDLSVYAGAAVQIAFYVEHSSGGDNNLHIDNVRVDYIPACLKPADLAEVKGSASKNSIQVDWVNEGVDEWKVQYKKTTATEWTTLPATAHPFTINGLESNTEYNVRVAALCNPADETSLTDYCKQIKVKTATGVPFAQGFNASSIPADWKRYEGVWVEVTSGGELTAVSTGWTATAKASANNVFPDSAYHLVLNVAGATCNEWIVSPTIQMEDGYQLSFDLALTKKSGTSPTAVTNGEQNDDMFIVGISEDGGVTWNAFRSWDNSNSQYDGINATAAGQSIKLPIPAQYVGKNVQFAFYGESTVAGGDNNLHISNVKIDLIPACENSSSLVIDAQTTSATATWDVVEGATWQYFYIQKPTGEFTPTDEMFVNTTAEHVAVMSGLQETTTYVIYLRKQCGETYSDIISREFSTTQALAELPYDDDFESGNRWYLVNGAATNAWAWGTAVNHGGSHALYVSNDNGVSHAYTNNSGSLVYAIKRFYFGEPGTYTFSFDWLANGEGNYDLLCVALVDDNTDFTAATTVSGTWSVPEGWTLLHAGTKLNQKTDWQTSTMEINIAEPCNRKVVMVWRNDGSTGTTPPAAVDNFHISRMACPTPTGLLISEVAADSAVIVWDDDTDKAWEYACVPASQEGALEYHSVNVNSIIVKNLTESTSYIFYLRKACGGDSATISFQTQQLPVAVGKTFMEDFESGNGWLFYNLETNAWVIDTAAHNGGSKSIYVSQDGGETNTYYKSTGGLIFATKMFTFEDANYNFQFDWRAHGEGTSTIYDYLRVALVPAGSDIFAKSGTTGYPTGYSATALPTGWVALDGGYLNLSTNDAWQTVTKADVPVEAGNYMIVLGWRWDTSGGGDPAAAVDNFRISKVLCGTPANLQAVADSLKTDSAFLKWEPQDVETTWLFRYKESGAEEWITLSPLTADSVWLTGLNHSTVYEAQVAAWCDPTDDETVSDFSASIQFATACGAVASISEDFEEGSTLCWSRFAETNYYGTYPAVIKDADLANSGTNCLYFMSQSGYAQDQYIILPELLSLEGLRIRFNARKQDETDDDTYAIIGIMTDPTDTTTFVAIDSLPVVSTTYAQLTAPFSSYVGEGKYVAIKMPATTGEWATICLDDLFIEEIPNCLEPNGPVVVKAFDAESATLAWPVEENGAWKYAYAPTAMGEPEDAAFVAITDTAIVLNNLEDNTPYTFYLRRNCGSMMSPSITAEFTTLLKTATVPYIDNFESANKWQFINGTYTNAWAYGTAAHNGEGTHALYISNDGGATNAYSHSSTAVYAVKPFQFNEDGFYNFKYDWKANGESNYDLLCVALVPDTLELTASATGVFSLPTGWTKLHEANKLNLSTTWNTEVFGLNVEAGLYKVVLLWRNDNSGGTTPPAAVDNFSIEKVTCIRPDSLVAIAENTTTTSIQIDWQPVNEENNWFVQYKKSADATWTLVAADVTAHPFTITGLEAANSYDIRVAAWCNPADSADASDYCSPITALTDCEAIGTFPYNQNFDGITGVTSGHVLPICWDYINTCTYSSYSYYPTTYKGTTYAHSGENSLKFYSYYYSSTTTDYDPQDQYAILPEMENVSGLKLKFYARAYTTTANSGKYTIGVMTNPADTSTFVPVYEGNLTSTTYAAYEVAFNHYEGAGQFIAIKMPAAGTPTTRGLYIDDIVVEQLPACMQPEDMEVSNITASSALIKWVNGTSDQTEWQIVYSCDPAFDLAEATPSDIASNPYALAGLLADTLYNVYVRANCDEDGFSAWSTISFRTASTCQQPADLAAADVTTNSAVISWNTYEQTGFNLRYSMDGVNWIDTINNVASPYVLGELEDAADYYVQVQVACDEEHWSSETLHFVTLQAPATLPYANDFETKNGWALINGTYSNAWAYGTAAHNGEGTHALYISNNNGVSHAYSHSATAVYATKLFQFEDGMYNFQYDWLANGESNYDLLCVALVPDTLELKATATGVFSLPTGWTKLHEANKLNLSTTWSTESFDLTVEAGLYKVVLLWRNDGSGGTTPPAAVDNIKIKKLTCLRPLNATVSEVLAHSAKLSWTAGEEGQNAWQIAIDTIADFNPDTLSNLIDVNDSSYVFANLKALTQYYVYVRANCGVDGASDWSAKKTFTTTVACPAPTGLKATLTPGNGAIATLSWNAGEAEAWQVEYSLNSDMSDSSVLIATEPVAYLSGLTAEATYYARVKADCGEFDGESGYSYVISFLPTNKYSITVNDGTQTNEFVPVYGYNADNLTRSQFIIPEAALEEITWDTIQALTFYGEYANSSRTTWGNATFEVYVTEAMEATMSELTDWETMTQVKAAGSLSIVDGKMEVVFSEPYQYQGGNLMIGFYQTVPGTWAKCNWYGVTATGASFGGYGDGNNVQQRNFLPKMTIEYVPGVAPACPNPKHLVVSDITDSEATFTWKAVEGATWEYALVEGSAEPTSFTEIAANTITIDNLAETTIYVFYLRRACGNDGYSEVISVTFNTDAHIATIPFYENFEGDNYWKFVQNDQTNAWTVGAAAGAPYGGGENALYVSNNGADYAYDFDAPSASFATIMLNFEQTDDYSFFFSWKGTGEGDDEDDYDYLRVVLAPADAELEAGTPALPEGVIALDNGGLYGEAEWTDHRHVANVVAGQYKLVIFWQNDEGNEDDFQEATPAAIDNIYVVLGDVPTPTSIEGGAGIESKAIKFIKNSHVYIQINGRIYDATGRRVE